MKFQIETLVDVTQTFARKGDDSKQVKQQANFMTLYNIIGLRTNPVDFEVTTDKKYVKEFGLDFKGKQRVWNVEFSVEAVDSISIEDMIADFDLVPFIDDLDETVKFDNNVFRSKDQAKINVIFRKVDK